MQELGFEISETKLVPPSHEVVCLGILINTRQKIIKIPAEKLAEIKNVCKQWTTKSHATKTQLQSLLGCLLYITKCIKPARYFLNRMFQLLRENHLKSKFTLTEDFSKDLSWFNVFLDQFNGTTYYNCQKPEYIVALDASLKALGGVFNEQVYTIQIPKQCDHFKIVHLEALNVLVALKIWGNFWKDKIIEIKCDNLAVVEVLRSGRARDQLLASIARNVWLVTAIFNITLIVNHIPGIKNNTADLLSRWSQSHTDFEKLACLVPNYVWVQTHEDLLKLNTYI